MKKSSYLFLSCLLCSRGLFGQPSSLLVHFNNADDRESRKNSIENSVKMEGFKNIAAQTSNGDTRIHIVFFDPTTEGVLEVDGPETPEQFAKNWMDKYDPADKRILFLFVKNGTYSFHSLYVTSNLVERQLPKLVINFISEQIVRKQSSVESAIAEGINAFKNAFDQRFKNRLVANAPQLIEDNKYYKGYGCIDFDYFYFKKIDNPTPQNKGCEQLFFSQSASTYSAVVPRIPPNIDVDPGKQSVLMDYFAAKPLSYKSLNPTNNQTIDKEIDSQHDDNIVYNEGSGLQSAKRSGYTYDYFDFSQPETMYTGLADTKIPAGMRTYLNLIYWNNFQFKEWRMHETEKRGVFLFEENKRACEGVHRVKIFNGHIKARNDQINEWQGLSTYSNFRMAQPTWCNVFARDLSYRIFESAAFSERTCGDILKYDFQAKPDLYVELTGSRRTKDGIWDLVNKGFSVYFVSNEHIETGFPDDYSTTMYRYRFENDNRYENSLETNTDTKYLTVGAGGKVGFKETYDSYLFVKTAQVFVYMGFLVKRYQE